MMEKISGIYKISSKRNPERYYIGSAINIANRWRTHLCVLRKNEHHSSKLQNHVNKYGINDLTFDIIIECDKHNLIALEQFYLDALSPWFNMSPTAGNTYGIKRSDETKRKLSEIHKGRRATEETRKKMSEAQMGRVAWNKGKTGYMPEEERRNISIFHTGKHVTKETKKRMSAAQMGHKGPVGFHHTPEAKKRISEGNKGNTKRLGHHATEETKKKMSNAQGGEKNPMYGRRGEKNPRYGKHHSLETRKRLVNAWKRRRERDQNAAIILNIK